MDNNVIVSTRLQSALLRAKVKNKDFAEATGITPETLSRYLHGKVNIPEEYIKRAAKQLHISAGYLTGEEDIILNTQLHDSLKKLFGMLNENNHIVCYMLCDGISMRHVITYPKHEIMMNGDGFIITNRETGEVVYSLSINQVVTTNHMFSKNDGTGIVSFIGMDAKNEKIVQENVFFLERNIF